MALVEALLIGLGSSIAKAILKLWLKEHTLAQDLSIGLVEILRSQTSDVLAQQRAKRQFEEIGERVAMSLEPLIASEGLSITDSGKTAVVLAVANVLESVKLDAALLASRNLDPVDVTDLMKANGADFRKDFNSTEEALYLRLLSEVAQYVVDIASQLPSFTERTLSEVLKREDQILRNAETILEEVRRIRMTSEGRSSDLEATRFEEQYRRQVIRKLDEIELFGVDLSSTSKRHRLSMAYISLDVSQQLRQLPLRTSTGNRLNATEADDDADQNLVSVEDALSASRRLLIKGGAGSGKTTLLQWVAVRSASKDFQGSLSSWNDTIPLFVRLRHHANGALPTPELIPGLVAPGIADTMPRNWVHRKMESGGAILLVDGLDEMNSATRGAVGEWIKDILDAYPDCRCIITTRPHAVDSDWLRDWRFESAELQPMTVEDISAFIDHWHSAVSERIQDPTGIDEVKGLAHELKMVVKINSAIRGLATSPLLCAMLCALHRDRNRQLPSDRVELYEACCHALIERRDMERRLDLSDYPKLTYRQKRVLLEDLAYWLILNGWSEVEMARAEQRLSKKLPELSGSASSLVASQVRRLLVERSGIIREPTLGYLDFTHRTFQEFLAACSIVQQDDLGILLKHAAEVQWQEVMVLAVGIASRKGREELLRGLIERGDTSELDRHQLYLLALACLETTVEISCDLQSMVESRLEQLPPPQSRREAKALAAAGDLCVSFLGRFSQRKSSIAASCVRALGLIGSDAALEVLPHFCERLPQSVIRELLMAWDNFDEAAYGEKVIRRLLQRARRLRLPSAFYLERLVRYGLVNASSLVIENCEELHPQWFDLLDEITQLELRVNHEWTDLRPISSLYGIELLMIDRFYGIQSLRSLDQLKGLRWLDINSCIHVESLSPLAELHNLRSLMIAGMPLISDLGPIGEMQELTSLQIQHCTEISDLGPLTRLRNLKTLTFWDCPKLVDLTPLKCINSLTSVRCWSMPKDLRLPESWSFEPRTWEEYTAIGMPYLEIEA